METVSNLNRKKEHRQMHADSLCVCVSLWLSIVDVKQLNASTRSDPIHSFISNVEIVLDYYAEIDTQNVYGICLYTVSKSHADKLYCSI